MRDPQADIGRRVWVACPRCDDQVHCAACAAGRSCETHWRFLLGAEGRRVFVQCPGCWHRWWHDTGFGVGDRPAGLDEVPDFPQRGGAAA
ncbi:hypothetical protein [Pseudonocardia acidicola]|uniref:Uncharacterized protein n=1 Tax=Pseudonocardia acidicola TaxID=2724939 RepID=A0ABX1S8Q5_9PSEU|nr:hypothetical protein [Pseudonocardia acidicola]NMH97941.1 hypothetical protein [Pseudonocardia acidicola]